MISAISTSASAATDARTPRRSPSMDAQLSNARAKLDDWITCPSAKTPEGKDEIKKATAQVNTVKAEIKKADDAKAQDVTASATKEAQQALEPSSDPAAGVAELARNNRAAASAFGGTPVLGTQVNVTA